MVITEHIRPDPGFQLIHRDASLSPRRREGVSDTYTESTRELIGSAKNIALEFGSSRIDTGHLLLAIATSQYSVGREAIQSGGLNLYDGEIRSHISRLHASPEEESEGDFTPLAHECMEEAAVIAKEMGARHVGTHHVLLSLARQDKGVGHQVLQAHTAYGTDFYGLEGRVLKILLRLPNSSISSLF